MPTLPAQCRYVPRSAVQHCIVLAFDDDACTEIAKRSRGTPRLANRLLKRVRDYADVLGEGKIDIKMANKALELMEIDKLGLDNIDRKLMLAIIKKFLGGPVGLETLASSTGEDATTIEDVYEPYLLQLGFIARTPRGRVALSSAYEHFGVELSADKKAQLDSLKAVSDDGIY